MLTEGIKESYLASRTPEFVPNSLKRTHQAYRTVDLGYPAKEIERQDLPESLPAVRWYALSLWFCELVALGLIDPRYQCYFITSSVKWRWFRAQSGGCVVYWRRSEIQVPQHETTCFLLALWWILSQLLSPWWILFTLAVPLVDTVHTQCPSGGYCSHSMSLWWILLTSNIRCADNLSSAYRLCLSYYPRTVSLSYSFIRYSLSFHEFLCLLIFCFLFCLIRRRLLKWKRKFARVKVVT